VKKRMASKKVNFVSSFVTAFSDTPGAAGVCVKYAMYDGSLRLSYFDAQWFRALHQCVEYYSGMHYDGSDMQRAADEPEFAARLPARHPIRTMHSEKPNLTERDYALAKEKVFVAALRVGDLGDSCRLDCSYSGGVHRTEVLPGYVAMTLCGSLKACHDLFGLITRNLAARHNITPLPASGGRPPRDARPEARPPRAISRFT
jgi:hypothetical protein